ncbi:MAG: Holliday junction branch migration protein RuvA [Pyramidobacter sp.]|nr:Holliday junction branch migration protein RuvA [Pyramidobacter sp.]
MLASIRGTVIQKNGFSVVVDCNGFGVEVLATRRAADLCKVDGQAFLYTYLQVSDAGIALYGFADESERRLFKLMILTKGVGGKVAVSVLQCLSPADIITAVESNDPKMLTTVPGIGKKTAERICFELADRIHRKGFEPFSGVSASGTGSVKSAGGVLDALESLGFDRATALHAYKQVQSEQGELDESAAIMACLRLLQPR